MMPCNRCGLCCELSLCGKGRRKDKKVKGNCIYLIKHDDKTTSCQLILEGKMPVKSILLGQGCIIQEDHPLMYKFQMGIRNKT